MEDKNSLLGSKKSKARKELRDRIASELFKSEEGNFIIFHMNLNSNSYQHKRTFGMP